MGCPSHDLNEEALDMEHFRAILLHSICQKQTLGACEMLVKSVEVLCSIQE